MNVYSSLFFHDRKRRQSRRLLTREWENCSIFMEYFMYIMEYDPKITRTNTTETTLWMNLQNSAERKQS